ncbi:MAG: type I restriction-modification enzyme R subunit C-terminal domain-containing protein, partial [Armatimonadota bacterium]
RYVIIDAVGVTDHCKNDSPPLEKNPSVPLKTILTAVGQGSTDPEVVSTLASRLARLDRIIGDSQRTELERLAGVPLQTLIQSLVNSVDTDSILDHSVSIGHPTEEGSDYMVSLSQHLREKAVEPFLDPKIRDHILNSLQDAEQTIDIVSKDELTFAGASPEATERAKTTIDSFAKYIEDNKDEITAIQLLYSKRKGRGPTLGQLKELANTIQQPPRSWTPEALWRAYEALEKSKVKGSGGKVVTDLVSLVRFALEQESILRPFGETVEDRFAVWLSTQGASGRTFNPEELQWLEMIRNHVATSLTIETDDFDVSPFAQAGGLGKAYQVFGEKLAPLLKELNEVLVA